MLTSYDILREKNDEINFNYDGNYLATMKILKKRLRSLEVVSQNYTELDHYSVQD